jgi:SAM-dependent methyltransferase
MNKRLALRLIGIALLLDGIGVLTLGPGYIRLWRIGPKRSGYWRAMSRLANIPAGVLRLAGLAEAGLGLVLLGQAPVSVLELYAAIAGSYDQAAPTWIEGYPEAYQAFDDALRGYLPAGGSILDLGCGTGANLERLLHLGLPFGRYVGVDISPDMLAQARRKFAGVENAAFQRLDLLRDPLPEGPFDLIISTWVFEHLPEPGQVAHKAWQRLKPEGHMVLFFEIWNGTWRSRVTEPLWRFFSAHLVREEEHRHFPGLVSMTRFGGLWTQVALFVSHKSERNA